jgi:prephenate dehydratase
VFEAVAGGSADAAAVAIENSAAGSIRETYDLLAEFDLPIVGAITVPIGLALHALPGETLGGIERVYSHAQALAQADAFLRGRPWHVLTTYNTAGAARMIAERAERHAGAIASPRVADLYGLAILVDDVQGDRDNRTRFAILAPAPLPAGWLATPPVPDAPFVTTLTFAVRNVPGSLVACLETFASRGVNLSRLESRPSRAARWEYVFYADLDAGTHEPALAAALAELRDRAAMVRVLGSYPRPLEG